MVPEQSHEFSTQREPTPTFSFLEYDKAWGKIPENTRASVDAWREEVLAICQAHGVDHPSKLVLAKTHASTQTLERVQNLLDDILYVFEHQDLPPEKKENFIDDQEYVVPLDCEENPSDTLEVFDLHGRFYFLDDSSDPTYFYTNQGEKQVLPNHIRSSEFALLGNRLVLIAINSSDHNADRFLTDLEGTPLDPPCHFYFYKKEQNHLLAVGKEPTDVYHPIGEDGMVHEDVAFSVKSGEEPRLLGINLIGGHHCYLTFKDNWMIYTADKTPIGNPKGYSNKPFLCEDQGRLTIVAKNAEHHGWWIYNAEGKPLRNINAPYDVEVHEVSVVHGTYLFGAKGKRGATILFDERGTVLWSHLQSIGKKSGEEKISGIIPSGSTFFFSTFELSSGSDREMKETFYDAEGQIITRYEGGLRLYPIPPVFVGEFCAYLGENNIAGSPIFLRLSSKHNHVSLDVFEKVYVMEAIDEHRLYVIGLERNRDGTFQMAKRVYDTRNVELPKEA